MKTILSLLVLLSASSAFALSDKVIAECKEVVTNTFRDEVASGSSLCTLNLDSVKVTEIDDRWYNPSKYIWFSATADCGQQHEVSLFPKMLQYDEFSRKCF